MKLKFKTFSQLGISLLGLASVNLVASNIANADTEDQAPGACKNPEKTAPEGDCGPCRENESEPSGETPSEGETASRACDVPNSALGSYIDNAALDYYNGVVDFFISNTASGCAPCGSSSASAGGLPSLKVTRLMRPRYGSFAVNGIRGSFGYGNYWKEVDKSLTFLDNGRIRLTDPSFPDKNIPAAFVPARGGWVDFENEYFSSITTFDASGSAITSASDYKNSRSAIVLQHDGSTDHYEIFWIRDNVNNLWDSPTNYRGFGRLVARMDRNGNAIQIDYSKAVRSDGFVAWSTANGWNRQNNFRQLWNKSKITDAYNREINITNIKIGPKYAIQKLALPNGEEITYEYGDLDIITPALTKVNHPDGSASTWSAANFGQGMLKITQLDPSASRTEQKKSIYLTHNWAPNGNGGLMAQSPGLIRRVDNGNGEIKYANNIISSSSSATTMLVIEGGNKVYKSTYGNNGATEADYVTDPAMKDDFYNDQLAATIATKKIGSPTYGSYGRTSDMTDALSRSGSTTRNPITHSGLLNAFSDGSTTSNTFNNFRQPLTKSDRIGRNSASTYDAFGNMLTHTRAVGTADETTITNIYNIRGQIIEQRDALYDANQPELHNTKYEYNTAGYMVKKIEAADLPGGTRPETIFSYDIAGRVTSTSDPLGRTVAFEYDSRDRVIKTTYNDTSTELVEYGTGENANIVIARTDRNGIRTEYLYDAAKRLLTQKLAAGLPEQSTTSYTYLTGTTQTISINRDGEITEYDYDYANRRIASHTRTDATKTLTTTNEYDQLGRLRSSTDAYGRSTYYLYNQNDQVERTVRETIPGGIGTIPAIVDGSSQTSTAHTYTLTDNNGNQLQTSGTHKVTYTDPRDTFLAQLPRKFNFNAKYLITDTYYDAAGQALLFKDARGVFTWTEYDNLGRTTRTIQAVGKKYNNLSTELHSEQDYDANSNVIETRSPRHFTEGTTLTGVGKDQYTYNGRNLRATHTTAVGSPAEVTQSWTYLLDGRSDKHTDFRGNFVQQLWHICCGRLQASIQRDGTSTSIQNTDYAGNTTHTAVAEVSNLQAYTFHNPTNAETLRETTTRYDGRRRPTHTTTWLTPLGTVDDDARISLGDAQGIPIAGLDGIPATDGLTTTYEYDENLTNGNGIDADYATQIADYIQRIGYNPFGYGYNGYAVAVTNPAGETSVQVTDGAGRTILTINPEGDIATMHYDEMVAINQLIPFWQTYSLLKTESQDALGNTNASYTDGVGRTLATENAIGSRSHMGYNANGSTAVTRDANYLKQFCNFDALNRQVRCLDQQEQAEGNDHTTTFNAASQPLVSTNADGETSTNVYDVRGRLSTNTDGNNITTSYTYDANNNLLTLEDGKGDTRSWTYDARNLNTTKTYPGGLGGGDQLTYNHDALGRILTKTEQNNDTCTNNYDLAGRLTEKVYKTGGTTTESTDTFTYDAASRILTTTKGRHSVTTQHTYAPDGLPLTETLIADNRTYTSSRTYDDANRPLTHTFPSGESTHWAYDARNLVNTVHYEDKIITTNTYDNGYRLKNQTFGNGLDRTINYTRKDNLRSSDSLKDGTQDIDDLTMVYNYAADKQILAEQIAGDLLPSSGFTAQYDNGNRITNWNRTSTTASTQTWNYDNAGNWNSTAKTIGNQTTTENRTHSAADQINTIAGNAATHDLKGNLTEYEINAKEYQVEYDLDNRIIKVDVDNDDVEYRYDAFGRRVIRQEGSTKSALIWWGNSECAEHKHQAGQTVIQNDIMEHPSRLNSVIARAVDGSKLKLQWYHKNYLDHVYAVSDDDGDILEHYRYTAFGEITIYDENGNLENTTQIDNHILWNTRRRDEVTGYYMYKYRHYSPELGRWPSRDPIGEDGGINLYAFVENSPVGMWDMMGMKKYQLTYYGTQPPFNRKNLTLGNVYIDKIHTSVKAGFKVILHQNDGSCTGLEKIFADMDKNGDKVINTSEGNHKVNVLGYSWGAGTAKSATDKLWKARNASKEKPVFVCGYKICTPLKVNVLVTLDPVVFLNGISKKKKSTRWVNYYQSKKGNFVYTDIKTKAILDSGSFLSRRLKGKSMPNADINKDSKVDFKDVWRTFTLGRRKIKMRGAGVNHDVVPMYFEDEATTELNK